MTNQARAVGFALAAIVCWSTVATVFKLSLQYLQPLQLVCLASVVSALVLFVIVCWQGKLALLRQFPRRHWLLCLLLGLLNPCLYYFVLFEAYDRLPAQEALAINYSWPAMLVLMSVLLLGQRVRPLEWLALALAYFGVLMIATQGQLLSLQFNDPLGVAAALASTLVWALYWILNLKQRLDATVTLWLSFLLVLPPLMLTTWWLAPVSLSALTGDLWPGLAGAAYVGVFEMGLTFVLWSTALSLSESTSRVSSLAFATPFLSLGVIALVLAEPIKLPTLAGLALIVLGIGIQAWVSAFVRAQQRQNHTL